MERLTVKYGDNTYDVLDPIDIIDNEYTKENYRKLVSRLGKYEDLEEQGKLLRLPCKVGDIVYSVSLYSGVCSHEIKNFQFDKSGQYACSNLKFPFSDFSKTIFLTQEQAEEVLKEMEG